MNFRKEQSGFTLIEVLLNIGITSMILVMITFSLFIVIDSRIKNQTIAEVDQQALQVMHIITQVIRNAENITSPSIGTSASTLTLDVIDPVKDSTVFDLSSGIIRITEGVSSPVDLTNSRVSVTSLNFSNLSHVSTPGIVQVEFTITHNNPEGRIEYSYTQYYSSSASLRQP